MRTIEEDARRVTLAVLELAARENLSSEAVALGLADALGLIAAKVEDCGSVSSLAYAFEDRMVVLLDRVRQSYARMRGGFVVRR